MESSPNTLGVTDFDVSEREQPEQYPPLPDECELYRAILYSSLLKGEKIKRKVFMRRTVGDDGKDRDSSGLSVGIADGRDEEMTYRSEAEKFRECVAVCRISTGSVRQIHTDVEHSIALDAVQDKPYHANIVGLPPVPPADIDTIEGKEDRARAELLGDELAKRAVIVFRTSDR